MASNDKIYDLVFSLGGSCVSALQLRRRGLRTCSLPFDWLFHVDDSLLSSLARCFRDGFSGWMAKENMRELEGDERGTSPHYQYKDLATGFRFIHDFFKPITERGEYERVKKQYDRRIRRLLSLIEKSKRVMMVLNSRWPIRPELVDELHEAMSRKWPDKDWRVAVVCLGQASDETIALGDYGTMRRCVRPENAYDYFQTNFEWSFLDDIELRGREKGKGKIIDIKTLRRGLSVHILRTIRNILGLRVRILGMELDFSVGKAD